MAEQATTMLLQDYILDLIRLCRCHIPLPPFLPSPFNNLPIVLGDSDGQGTRPHPIRLAHLTGHALQEVPRFTIEDVGGVVGGEAIKK